MLNKSRMAVGRYSQTHNNNIYYTLEFYKAKININVLKVILRQLSCFSIFFTQQDFFRELHNDKIFINTIQNILRK